MKCHKYAVYDNVVVNDKCGKDIENLKGRSAIIIDLHYGAIYDYFILCNGVRVKVKETEIDLVKVGVID